MPTTANTDRSQRRLILLWIILSFALVLAFLADEWVMTAVKPLNSSPFEDFIHSTIRWLGTGFVQAPAALLMILAGVRLSRRLMRVGGWTLAAFVLSGISANIIKVIVHRPRPWVDKPAPETWLGYLSESAFQSFPSAETTTTFAVAVTIAAWYPSWRIPLLAIAIMVGIARVLVSGHHLSDIVAGAMLGIAVAHWLVRIGRRRGLSDAA